MTNEMISFCLISFMSCIALCIILAISAPKGGVKVDMGAKEHLTRTEVEDVLQTQRKEGE